MGVHASSLASHLGVEDGDLVAVFASLGIDHGLCVQRHASHALGEGLRVEVSQLALGDYKVPPLKPWQINNPQTNKQTNTRTHARRRKRRRELRERGRRVRRADQSFVLCAIYSSHRKRGRHPAFLDDPSFVQDSKQVLLQMHAGARFACVSL